MLRSLSIKNFAIIEDLALSFEGGFTAITGETGAGKSILVDALSLLCGGRASAELLRSGAERLTVAARFDATPETAAVLTEAGIESPAELVLRRDWAADGKGRAFVNDEPVTARLLSRVADGLLFLHGQGGERALLEPEAALEAIDEFGGLLELRGVVAEDAAAVAGLRARREELLSAARQRDERIDLLKFQIAEIDAAGLAGIDEDALASERNRLKHSDRIASLGEAARQSLSEGEGSAADRLGQAHRAIAELARIDSSLSAIEREAAELKSRVADLAREVAAASEMGEADPGRLTAIETQLDRISRLTKKHGRSVAELRDYRSSAAAEIEKLQSLERDLSSVEAELSAARESYGRNAGRLSDERRKAVRRFAADIGKELAEVALERAKLGPVLAERGEESSPFGLERADFMFSANPGEPERSLSKVASGGELSRVQLALETVRVRRDKRRIARVLIFDEVDAGIGGRVAEAVGRKLRELARRHQVLCVTHVPQIAALADRQLRAVKKVSGGRTRAGVEDLSSEERVEEIARMLAGDVVSPTARSHARALLESR